MTEPSFFVLAALAGGPLHGYAIVGEVDELSASRVKLKIGSLYGVLDRLVAEGQVELDREEVHNGRLRRYYRITNGGVHALRAEAARQAANVRLANGRIRALQSRLGVGGEFASQQARGRHEVRGPIDAR